MKRDAALGVLAAHRQRSAGLLEELAALRAPPADGGVDSLAYGLAGAQAKWDRWRQARIAAINATLARLRAEEAPLVHEATRAIGRCEALGELIAAEREQDRIRRRRT